VTIGAEPELVIEADEAITDADGNAVTVNNKELEAVTTDSGDLVTTPDGNIIVDVVNPNTNQPTGEKGVLVIDEQGQASLTPLPEVLVNDAGVVINGNGDVVTGSNGETYHPNYDDDGALITDATGHLVLDVQRPDGSVDSNGATMQMADNGTVTIGAEPEMVIEAGKSITDADGNKITVENNGTDHEVKAVTTDTGSLVTTPDGHILVNLIDPDTNQPTGDKAVLLIDEQGQASLAPLPPVLVNQSGVVVDDHGNKVTVTQSGNDQEVKPVTTDNGELVTTSDGNAVVDVIDPNTGQPTGDKGVLIIDDQGQASLAPLPPVLVNEAGVVIDSDGNKVTVTQNGSYQEVTPVTTDNGELVTTSDGHIVVDALDPNTNQPTGNKGVLIIDDQGQASLAPLPPVLVNEAGDVIDGNGVVITGSNGETYQPYLGTYGNPVTNLEGHAVVNVYSAEGTLSSSLGATINMAADGTVTTTTTQSTLMIDEDTLVDNSHDSVTYGPEHNELHLIDGGVRKDINGNVLFEVVDSNGNATGEVRIAQVDTSNDVSLLKPGLIVDTDNTVIDAYGNEIHTANGGKVELEIDDNGNPVIDDYQSGYVIKQYDYEKQQDVENTVFVNFNTNEVWTDFDGNLVTQKNVPQSDWNSPSMPTVRANDTAYIGFSNQPLKSQPVIASTTLGSLDNGQSFELLFITNRGSVMSFGSGPQSLVIDGYSETYKNVTMGIRNIGTKEEGSNTEYGSKGIFETTPFSNCEFHPDAMLQYANNTVNEGTISLLALQHAMTGAPEVCFPNNLAGIGVDVSAPTELNVMLTKNSELWSIGTKAPTLGGYGTNAWNGYNMPVKYAEGVKTATMIGGEAKANYILDNEGVLWKPSSGPAMKNGTQFVLATSSEATTGGWTKLSSKPNGETIVNMRSLFDGDSLIVATTTGNYYFYEVSEDRYTKVNLPAGDQVRTLLGAAAYVGSDTSAGVQYQTTYLAEDGFIYSNQTDGQDSYKKVTHYYNYSDLKGNAKTSANFPDDKVLSDDTTFEWVARAGDVFGMQLLKGSDGYYYYLEGNYMTNGTDETAKPSQKSMLVAGIHYDTEKLLIEDMNSDNEVKLIRLTNDLGYVQFLNSKPNWEFYRHNPMILVNPIDKKLAIIGHSNNSYLRYLNSKGWYNIMPSIAIIDPSQVTELEMPTPGYSEPTNVLNSILVH
uniref:hypothetical protein n=1 Tax=Vibrio sonorensis TaxID=1004316 RepID=UPI001585EC17